jgi:CRP/FNR family transcriptional regulator, cyclic AMP receptor protein
MSGQIKKQRVARSGKIGLHGDSGKDCCARGTGVKQRHRRPGSFGYRASLARRVGEVIAIGLVQCFSHPLRVVDGAFQVAELAMCRLRGRKLVGINANEDGARVSLRRAGCCQHCSQRRLPPSTPAASKADIAKRTQDVRQGGDETSGDFGQPAQVIARTFACTEDLARVIGGKARLRQYPPRAAIVRGEDPSAHVHLMVAGHARMMATALEGRMSVIEDYREGDMFGERGLFGDAGSPHDVLAVKSSRVGAFANPDFLALMSNYSCVALAVSRLLVARLDTAQRRLAEGTTLSVRGRVCAELLRLARAGSAMTIAPAPVLAQLALRVDSTRESVSRAIGALEKRGLIRRDADALVVVAPHRLEELVY